MVFFTLAAAVVAATAPPPRHMPPPEVSRHRVVHSLLHAYVGATAKRLVLQNLNSTSCSLTLCWFLDLAIYVDTIAYGYDSAMRSIWLPASTICALGSAAALNRSRIFRENKVLNGGL